LVSPLSPRRTINITVNATGSSFGVNISSSLLPADASADAEPAQCSRDQDQRPSSASSLAPLSPASSSKHALTRCAGSARQEGTSYFCGDSWLLGCRSVAWASIPRGPLPQHVHCWGAAIAGNGVAPMLALKRTWHPLTLYPTPGSPSAASSQACQPSWAS
jgi:hypothetical protein